jgi:hypothetical protein
MTKRDFYLNNLYSLENRFAEDEIIKLFEDENLKKIIQPFLIDVIDLLYSNLKSGTKVDIESINIPYAEKNLDILLKGKRVYDIFYEKSENKKLSEGVCKKFLSRLFNMDGHNNEGFIIQNYYHKWLEKQFAEAVTNDSRFESEAILVDLVKKAYMLHYFYHYLLLYVPAKWINEHQKDWISVNEKPKKLLEGLRSFDNDYFDTYVDDLQNKQKTDLWEYVWHATRWSDNAMLNDKYSFKSAVLFRKNLNLWVRFWDNLHLPIIQDCAFHDKFASKDYISIIETIASEEKKLKSDIKVIALIVAKNYFEASVNITENLSIYLEPDRITEANRFFFIEGESYYKEWLIEKEKHHLSFITKLKEILSQQEIEDWIFSYRHRPNNGTNAVSERYNQEINSLVNAMEKVSDETESLNADSFNLQKFNYYIEKLKKSKSQTIADQLLEAFITFMKSDKFHWDKSFSEPFWSSVLGIGYLISISKNPMVTAKKLTHSFRVNHQGWKPTAIDYKSIAREAFIFSGVFASYDYDATFKNEEEKNSFYRKLLSDILIQDQYSQIDSSEYYQQPLLLLLWMTRKRSSLFTNEIEKDLIIGYDKLYSLLYILSFDDENICANSKKLLKTRIKNEFLIEKRKLNQKKRSSPYIERMEKMASHLKVL